MKQPFDTQLVGVRSTCHEPLAFSPISIDKTKKVVSVPGNYFVFKILNSNYCSLVQIDYQLVLNISSCVALSEMCVANQCSTEHIGACVLLNNVLNIVC